MVLLFYNRYKHVPPDDVDPTPVILSDSAVSTPEGDINFLYSVVTDIAISQVLFDGGPDDAKFQIGPNAVQWVDGFNPDYESPADANTNNTYVTYLKAVSTKQVESAQFVLTVTVTDVTEVVVGATTFTLTAPSETELQITNPAATNADTFEFDVDGNNVWTTLV